MKRADLDILGNLFNDAKEGFQFGYGVRDSIEARKQQQKDRQYALAEAQQRAAFAQQKQAIDQQKIENDKRRIDLTASGQAQARDLAELNSKNQANQQSTARKLARANAFKLGPNRNAVLAMSDEEYNTPEGQAKIEALQRQEDEYITKRDLGKYAGKQSILTQQSVLRKYLGNAASSKMSKGMEGIMSQTNVFLNQATKEGKAPEEIIPILKTKLAVAKEVVNKYQQQGLKPLPGDVQAVNALEAQINAYSQPAQEEQEVPPPATIPVNKPPPLPIQQADTLAPKIDVQSIINKYNEYKTREEKKNFLHTLSPDILKALKAAGFRG